MGGRAILCECVFESESSRDRSCACAGPARVYVKIVGVVRAAAVLSKQ